MNISHKLIESIIFYTIVSASILTFMNLVYSRTKLLKKYGITRRLGSIIEEYQKLLAQDFNIELKPLPQSFGTSFNALFIILFSSLFLSLLTLVPDPRAGFWTHVALLIIAIYLLISGVICALNTYHIIFTDSTIGFLPLLSFTKCRGQEFQYADIKKCTVILRAQKGMYGRYGVGFKMIVTNNSDCDYKFVLNNFQTPTVRVIIANLIEHLGERVVLDCRGF